MRSVNRHHDYIVLSQRRRCIWQLDLISIGHDKYIITYIYMEAVPAIEELIKSHQ